ncbi:MAG: cobyric acid synthase [Planctomycetota bacterium]|jgi:adenosylcobyric acid synthase|nr:cobyric acid synthase [Planctomycetota bacterium]
MKTPDRTLARCLAVLGTGSDVGKSIVVTALCRIFSNRGVRVAPFKAQNMSNNSYVTAQGGEMGRAQIVQAEAARVPPHTDMNPVLLKPCSDTGAQVVLHGRALGTCEARNYFADTGRLRGEALAALDRLRRQFDLVILEGAGSCAEVNLRERDFVNFRAAQVCDAPVILVADIDRGGVFAQVVGTLEVLPPQDRGRVKGIVINRFRGDAALFADGMDYLRRRTGLPMLGLIPFFRHIEIESEDGMPLESLIDPPGGPDAEKVNIAVLRVPHISNFTDFNVLSREPSVRLHYLTRPRTLDGYDLLLLPGSKNVLADLQWLCDRGWESRIRAFVEDGGRIGGLCGGYQMLGQAILDPHGVEGIPGRIKGLGLLPVVTTLEREKTLARTSGVWIANGMAVEGYEIHMGVTERPDGLEPAIRTNDGRTEGARTPDGRFWGTYLHGLFDAGAFRRAFLRDLAPDRYKPAGADLEHTVGEFKDRQYDLLAQHFETHLDMNALIQILEGAAP